MRAAVMVFMALVATFDLAMAEEPRYRILFAEHAAEPIVAGEAGVHNAAEVKRIADTMRVLAPLGTVRFVFVAPRAGICGPQCAAEHLMWQRVNAATAALRSEASRAGASLPFQLIGWSFVEELPAGARLPPPSGAGSGIDLRLHLEAARQGSCPWRVLVHDPALPPVIGAHDGEPALPVPDGKTITVSAGARVAIATASRSTGQPVAVWQDGQGEPHKVDQAAFASTGTPLPPNIARLLLLNSGSAEARALLARITSGTREYAARDRGFDDHVGPVTGGLLPATSARCEVAIQKSEEQ